MVFTGTKMEGPRENIRWDLHERHLQSVFAMHFLQDRFCDVTLACKDGQTIRAHRTILCACSGYFDSVLTGDTSGKDMLVIMKDCDFQNIQLLIQFMYYGEINVDENRLRSLLETADGLQINGLTEAFHNFNEQYRDNFVVRRTEPALPDHPRTYRIDATNASPLITPVGGATTYPFGDAGELGYIVDKKEPDWSDNEDDDDCVRVYLVSEDGDENFNFDKKEITNVNAKRPGFTPLKSFLPIQDTHMDKSNCSTNESSMFAVVPTNRISEQLDLDGRMGSIESEDGENFNGWYLTPVDDKVQQGDGLNSFSTTKKMAQENILSQSRNQPKQALASNTENRNRARLVKIDQPPSLASSKLQPKLSSAKLSVKSTPRCSTSKMDLLNRLQRYLERKFDGRIKVLNIDDLQHYSVENGKGSCHVKCPICDKLTKVRYGKNEPNGKFYSCWILSDEAAHINRHFK